MDQELKQRMIGASVIIALAAIFVPMLFDGDVEEKHNKNISINIPEEPDNTLEIKKFSIDKPVAEVAELPSADVELVIQEKKPVLLPKEDFTLDKADSTQPEKKPENRPEATNEGEIQIAEQQPADNQVADSKTEATQQAPVKPEISKPITQAPTSQPKQPVEQVYRVKLGSFSQKGNAEKVKSSLLQKNIKSIVEYSSGLKLYRVWSQEIYQTEETANQYVTAVNQLKLNIGTPKVITLAASEVEVMATQGQLGWVVQLGSFSEKNNAIELRNKVNAAGFRSFVDQVISSGGKTMYRLRVGPLMEKIDAERTQLEIKSRLKLDGLVKNHDLSQIVN